MKKGIIYKCTNKINNKIYIGQTSRTVNERKDEHLNESFKKLSKTHFHRALRKYGIENFIWKKLENVMIENLNEKEEYYIKKYDSLKNGYNMTINGYNLRGFCHSDKTKKKMSEKTKGKNNPMYGTKRPDFSEYNRTRINPRLGIKLSKKQKEHLAYIKSTTLYFMKTPIETEADFWLFNLKKFARVRNLNQSSLNTVARGIFSQHKGYKVIKI